MKKRYLILMLVILSVNIAIAQKTKGLILLAPANKGNSLKIIKSGDDGYVFETTGDDPHVALKVSSAFEKEKRYVLTFEYTDLENNGILNVYLNVERLVRKDVSLVKADGWTKAYVDLTDGGNAYESVIRGLRLDTPPAKGKSMKIRKLELFEADKELLQRCAIGDMVDVLDTLGIEPENLTADNCALETVSYLDDSSTGIVKSVYGHLDFDARTKQASKKAHNKALVPLGPVIVAGEGEHPDNHTVVRILSKYQVQEVQFLAYSPSVKGGVGVNSLSIGEDKYGFVCHPLTDAKTNSIKLFNRYGGLLKEIKIAGMQPPYIVAAGEFYKGNSGDEIAVASRYSASGVVVYSLKEKRLLKVPAPVNKKSTDGYHLALIKKEDSANQLVYQDIKAQKLYSFDGKSTFKPYSGAYTLPGKARVFNSIYTDKKNECRRKAGYCIHLIQCK